MQREEPACVVYKLEATEVSSGVSQYWDSWKHVKGVVDASMELRKLTIPSSLNSWIIFIFFYPKENSQEKTKNIFAILWKFSLSLFLKIKNKK